MSWLSNVLGRGDDLPRLAAELAERLNRQRSKWLEAVSVECRDGEAVIGAAPAREWDPLAAPVMVSAFQAVHVLSMVHANEYVPASEMSRGPLPPPLAQLARQQRQEREQGAFLTSREVARLHL